MKLSGGGRNEIRYYQDFWSSYKTVYCSCGSELYDKSDGKDLNFTCMRCEKTYPKLELEYDEIEVNTMTRWIFPMVRRKKEEL